MEDKIRAFLIFEILGKPADYIKEALGGLVEKLGKTQGVSIKNNKMHEPKKLEDEKYPQKDLFTTFAEVELEADGFETLLFITFNFMPSHVEIIDPQEARFANSELSSIISTLITKLHRYDELVKGIAIERNLYKHRVKELEEKFGVKPEDKLESLEKQENKEENSQKEKEETKENKKEKPKKEKGKKDKKKLP
ncbi:MAG: hypothetical protein ACP5OG_03560 [Candidatus Nanoarchaeia archaeon]